MKKLWLAILCLLFASSVHAEPSVAIRTEASPREIYIGDPVSVGVLVTTSSDVASTPLLVPPTTGEFELLAISTPIISIGKHAKVNTAYQFVITTFSTGTLTFPSLPLMFSTVDGAHTEAKTEEISIKVKSLLAEKGDEGNIRPLKGLFNFKSYFWVWVLLGILALGAAATLGWKWLTKPKEGAVVASGPSRPPEEVAWESIHKLEDADLISSGQTKEFYYRLSVILRQYMENRFSFSALERTTSELIGEFRRQNFSMEFTNLCREFFDNADLVKFAKFTPAEDEITADLNRVKEFINLSTPKKVAPEPPEKIPA